MTPTPHDSTRVVVDGAKLREMRAARGLSQRAVADAVGKTQAYVSSIEGPRHVPTTWGMLRQVAAAVGADRAADLAA
jgi:transcriptional regulator with XRE-family HTH domain